MFYVSLVLYMLKKKFDQLCLVIANLLAHYVLKIGNNWLYKGYWQGKLFWKICEKIFFLASWLKFFFVTLYAGNKYIYFLWPKSYKVFLSVKCLNLINNIMKCTGTACLGCFCYYSHWFSKFVYNNFLFDRLPGNIYHMF